MSRVLILRAEPGASETAARAAAMGLEPVVAPLFTIRPVAWDAAATPEAVLITSANAARHGGEGVKALLCLPCYTVGEATAAAARAAGFGDVRTGPSDGAAAVAMMAADKVHQALHLCGRDHVPLAHPDIAIDRRIVYEAVAADALPKTALEAIRAGAVVLLHSPRAAALLTRLVPDRAGVRLAAISPAAAAAAGEGWVVAAACLPRDAPLLELAAKLCQSSTGSETGPGE